MPAARGRDAPPSPHPAIRRTFMRVCPDYFTWPVEAQERYRVEMPDKDEFRVRQALLKALFGIRVKNEKELDAATEEFGDEQYLLLNRAMLPVTGVGDDYLFLNEHMAEGRSVLDFETLYDYDLDDHLFQERCRKEEIPDYVERPYRGALCHSWARLLIDGEFYYAALSMAAVHVSSDMEEFGDEKLTALIPHRYVPGRNHGKRAEGGGTIFDHRIDAGGMEPQFDELQRRWWDYRAQRGEALLTEFDAKARRAVYMVDRSGEIDPHMNFIFSDKTALQAVRFRHFMVDCRALAGDRAELDSVVGRERQALEEFMESAYQDIVANFNPKVARFQRKRKVIIADGALKDFPL